MSITMYIYTQTNSTNEDLVHDMCNPTVGVILN